MFHPPPSLVDVFGLFRQRRRRHSRQSVVCVICHRFSRFHFPASLGSTLVRRFLATTDALTPAGRLFGPAGHEHRSVPGRSPCLPRSRLLPFCLQPPFGGPAAFLPSTVLFSTRTLSCC